MPTHPTSDTRSIVVPAFGYDAYEYTHEHPEHPEHMSSQRSERAANPR